MKIQEPIKEERMWKTMEICAELGVTYSRLMALALSLRKRREVTPESKEGQLFWSDADVERLRRRVGEWNKQGLTTAEVAAGVGLKRHQVLALMHGYEIEVARRGMSLIWDEAAVARLRAIVDQKGTARLTGNEVATRLNISTQTLYRLVQANSVPLIREGNRPLWDEAAISAVSELVRQLEIRRASKRRLIEAQADFKELGTMAVCRKLGIDYETLLSLIRPFRKDLKLSLRGRLSVWTPEAVAKVEEALKERSQKADDRLHSQIEQLKLRLRKQLSELEETTKELSTPPAVTSFISVLPDASHVLPFPVAVLVYTLRGGFRAVLVDIELEALGPTPHKAIQNLRTVLLRKYRESREAPNDSPEAQILAQLIVPIEQS